VQITGSTVTRKDDFKSFCPFQAEAFLCRTPLFTAGAWNSTTVLVIVDQQEHKNSVSFAPD
jgi:hypothetical protein